LRMHGMRLEVDCDRGVKRYGRRLEMVEEMLREEGRNDEAMRGAFARMGMTVPKKETRGKRGDGGIGAVMM
jgi:hypothetical protein